MGTPQYMSPEQARGDTAEIDARTDTYALGAILYELLTGRPPFVGIQPLEVLNQVIADEPVQPSQLVRGVPKDLQTICLKCLRKEPNQRYKSAEQLVADLQHFLSGEPITARSLNLLQRVAWTIDRNRDFREFTQYSRLFFVFAAILFVVEMLSYKLFLDRASVGLFAFVQSLRLVLFLLALSHYRREGLLPQNDSERLLWSIWTGYVLACAADSTAFQCANGWSIDNACKDFPHLFALTGLAFFAMGSVYWGWFYLFGLVFWITGFVMHQFLLYAQPVFGVVWTIALIAIGLLLRRLSLHTSIGVEKNQSGSRAVIGPNQSPS